MPRMRFMRIDRDNGRLLLQLALESIEFGLAHGRVMTIDVSAYPLALREKRACFLTLTDQGVLRGCTGSLEPDKTLVEHVVTSAYATAFNDPRFPPLSAGELDRLTLELAVLGPLRPLDVGSEEALIAALEPGRDGVVLQVGAKRATFLPKVWEQLPQPRDFMRHLRLKAGLAEDYWSDTVEISRYRTDTFSASVRELRACA